MGGGKNSVEAVEIKKRPIKGGSLSRGPDTFVWQLDGGELSRSITSMTLSASYAYGRICSLPHLTTRETLASNNEKIDDSQ